MRSSRLLWFYQLILYRKPSGHARRSLFHVALLLMLSLLLLAGCMPGFDDSEEFFTETPILKPTATAPGPRLRVFNAGDLDIKGLVVLFPDQRIEIGDVPAGATTVYMDAPKGVYNYAAYEYLANGETISQPVIDWLGESPKSGYDFTYTLVYRPDNPAMQRIELSEVTIDR